MTRRYDDPVDVRRRDEVPVEFLWRGRLYVVRDVLSHWVETGPWWRSGVVRAAYAGETADDTASEQVGRLASEPVGGAGSSETALALDPGEREMWRVEASAGRSRGTGVFDLCFDWGAGVWTLAHSLD